MRNLLVLKIFCVTVLSAGVSLPAQQTIPDQPAMDFGCPIGFRAEVNGRAIARSIEDQKKNGDTPLLDLTFTVRDTPRILSASVTVHGFTSYKRFLPVDGRSDESTAQTFELGRGRGTAGLTSAEVRATKMLFVNWAEVTELRYADGSAWHPRADAQCRTVPNKLRLVDATAVQQTER